VTDSIQTQEGSSLKWPLAKLKSTAGKTCSDVGLNTLIYMHGSMPNSKPHRGGTTFQLVCIDSI
jgi:hypothetical protein